MFLLWIPPYDLIISHSWSRDWPFLVESNHSSYSLSGVINLWGWGVTTCCQNPKIPNTHSRTFLGSEEILACPHILKACLRVLRPGFSSEFRIGLGSGQGAGEYIRPMKVVTKLEVHGCVSVGERERHLELKQCSSGHTLSQKTKKKKRKQRTCFPFLSPLPASSLFHWGCARGAEMGRWTALDCVAIQKGEAGGKGMAADFECDFALFWRSHKAHVNGQVKEWKFYCAFICHL